MKYRVEILFLLPAAYRFPLLQIFAPDCTRHAITNTSSRHHQLQQLPQLCSKPSICSCCAYVRRIEKQT
jgi:hypothetical protein